jgi:hypothetical protein
VTGIAAAFSGHGYCTGPGSPNSANVSVPRFINTPADSQAEQGDTNGSMHPNDLGQQAIAGVLDNAYYAHTMSLSLSGPPTFVAGNPATFTVQALSFTNVPLANAQVTLGTNVIGQTGSNGGFTVGARVFPAAGTYTLGVHANGYSDPPPIILTVQPRPYSVVSSPSPIPVKTLIPALTLTATDSATGQAVPGTFTFAPPGGAALSVREGATASNVTVPMGHKTETIIGPTGKPITVTVSACPTLTFQPDSAAYAGQDFTKLITCTP